VRSLHWIEKMQTMILARAVRERIALVLAFAFSRRPIYELIGKQFRGEFKHLRLALEFTEESATKAMIEMAAFLRLVDDEQMLSGLVSMSYGTVIAKDGTKKPLSLRDLTNKIMHANTHEWNFDDPNDPKFICKGSNSEKWTRAEISMVALMVFCGYVAS
jgi:hypothetical protein